MKTAVIWDLDGTLFDSYPVIVESIYLTFQEAGVHLSREEIKEFAIRTSSNALFYDVADERGIAAEALFERYRQLSRARHLQIVPMDGAMEILELLHRQNVSQFVYTHRGKTTIPVLDHLNMTSYFQEILTSESGFARKPSPEAIDYLIQTYDLDREHTYYVGDRKLDMACAQKAGITGVLLRRPGDLDVADGTEKCIVSELREILDVVINKGYC